MTTKRFDCLTLLVTSTVAMAMAACGTDDNGTGLDALTDHSNAITLDSGASPLSSQDDANDAALDDGPIGDVSIAAPTAVSVAPGSAPGTAVISFAAPPSASGDTVNHYTITAEPGSVVASGLASPIAINGLTPQTAYTFSVVAVGATGSSLPISTGLLGFYDVVETFREPKTQPNDTIFAGTFTFDFTNHAVSNLSGSLTQSMTLVDGSYGGPMTTVPLSYQLSSVPTTLGGADGLLVATFTLPTVDTFDGGGFAPGGAQYYGLSDGAPNNHNAYALIFINLGDPTLPLVKEQIDKLAYADCTVGGMMGRACMTGTTKDGYGREGTMKGFPVSQIVSKR